MHLVSFLFILHLKDLIFTLIILSEKNFRKTINFGRKLCYHRSWWVRFTLKHLQTISVGTLKELISSRNSPYLYDIDFVKQKNSIYKKIIKQAINTQKTLSAECLKSESQSKASKFIGMTPRIVSYYCKIMTTT